MSTTKYLMFLAGVISTYTINPIRAASVRTLNGRKVILVSMDGFRYDYLTKANTPNFDAMIANGVTVPYVNNIFVTKTFPCHYTIATGLYEESHGIVGNNMYDPVFNASFRMGNIETRWWDGAEPIWINAVKAGLKVGTYFWPGSEAELQGLHPTEFRNYDGRVPFEERVDTLIDEWLSKRDFDFGIIYFNEPDNSGHKHGPDSPYLVPVIERMDTLVGYFMKKLTDVNLKDKVDFIITSDHGMTDVDAKTRLISIRDHVNDSLLLDVVGGGAIAELRPQPGKDKELADALTGIEHIQVYLKEDIPDEYHHKNHRRIQSVVVVADEGWEVRKTQSSHTMKGNHGYRNDYINMRPIFVASGPSFKKGVEIDPIKSVDIYPLLCHLLNLEPAPHNGSFERVKGFLNNGQNSIGFINTPVYLMTSLSIVAISQIVLS